MGEVARIEGPKSNTTETLRDSLIDILDGITGGTITSAQASAAHKIATSILGTLEIELKYALTLSRLDKDNEGISPGPLLLTQDRS